MKPDLFRLRSLTALRLSFPRLICGAILASLAFGFGTDAAEKNAEPKSTVAKTVAKESAKPAVSYNDWVYIDNGSVKIGVKKSSGAGIAWMSESGSERNLINNFDRGRLVQQSYYGREDGSMWDKQPWRWNPVQGGDWKGNPSTVLELKATTNSIYAKTMPKHWATGVDLPDFVMEEWITLAKRAIMIRYRATYTGKETHPESDQEIPAIFLAPDLDTLVVYDGDKPWTNGALNRSKPGWPNEARNITEHWAAYVDKNDYGLGAYVGKAKRLTCYRFGEGGPEKGECSYFAPVTTFAFTPGKTYDYEVFLIMGTVKEIREGVYQLNEAFSAVPPSFSPGK